MLRSFARAVGEAVLRLRRRPRRHLRAGGAGHGEEPAVFAAGRHRQSGLVGPLVGLESPHSRAAAAARAGLVRVVGAGMGRVSVRSRVGGRGRLLERVRVEQREDLGGPDGRQRRASELADDARPPFGRMALVARINRSPTRRWTRPRACIPRATCPARRSRSARAARGAGPLLPALGGQRAGGQLGGGQGGGHEIDGQRGRPGPASASGSGGAGVVDVVRVIGGPTFLRSGGGQRGLGGRDRPLQEVPSRWTRPTAGRPPSSPGTPGPAIPGRRSAGASPPARGRAPRRQGPTPCGGSLPCARPARAGPRPPHAGPPLGPMGLVGLGGHQRQGRPGARLQGGGHAAELQGEPGLRHESARSAETTPWRADSTRCSSPPSMTSRRPTSPRVGRVAHSARSSPPTRVVKSPIAPPRLPTRPRTPPGGRRRPARPRRAPPGRGGRIRGGAGGEQRQGGLQVVALGGERAGRGGGGTAANPGQAVEERGRHGRFPFVVRRRWAGSGRTGAAGRVPHLGHDRGGRAASARSRGRASARRNRAFRFASRWVVRGWFLLTRGLLGVGGVSRARSSGTSAGSPVGAIRNSVMPLWKWNRTRKACPASHANRSSIATPGRPPRRG